MSRDPFNYPPKQRGYSCHHVAYPYKAYQGEIEHRRFQHDPALLQPVPNFRHNIGPLALHNVIDPVLGTPPKPRRTLMLDAIDYMRALDPAEARIRKLGFVIGFFMDEAEFNGSPEIADQSQQIAEHYTAQYRVITEGGEAFIRNQQYKRPIEVR
jgi:hypothetical protein